MNNHQAVPKSSRLGIKAYNPGYTAIWRTKGPKRRTREGGSEWEPIKILFKNSAYEADFTHAPPQASLAKFT
jgi:hypothetical protein